MAGAGGGRPGARRRRRRERDPGEPLAGGSRHREREREEGGGGGHRVLPPPPPPPLRFPGPPLGADQLHREGGREGGGCKFPEPRFALRYGGGASGGGSGSGGGGEGQFSRSRWSRCSARPAPCCGAAWRGGRRSAPTCGCWTCDLPASSPCPGPGSPPEAPASSGATTACGERGATSFEGYNRLRMTPDPPHPPACSEAPGAPALPSALVVEEEDKVEVLACFLSHLLPQLQHLQGGHGDGDAVVEHAFPRHLGVNDLPEELEGRAERGKRNPECRSAGGGTWISEAPGAGGTHQRRVGGVPPALGPHQVQGIQGGILVLGQPPRAAPHALAHHCAGGKGRGESAASPTGATAPARRLRYLLLCPTPRPVPTE